jgi:hypothetical protein
LLNGRLVLNNLNSQALSRLRKLQDSAKDELYDRSEAYQYEEYYTRKHIIVLMCSTLSVSVSSYRDLLIDFYDDTVKTINTQRYPTKKLLAIMTELHMAKLPLILEAIRQADVEIASIEIEANREF